MAKKSKLVPVIQMRQKYNNNKNDDSQYSVVTLPSCGRHLGKEKINNEKRGGKKEN